LEYNHAIDDHLKHAQIAHKLAVP